MTATSASEALLRYPAQLPRYTSYPTAPHFHAIGSECYASWLAALPPETPVSVYVHIPYCRKLCSFCGCHTHITQRYDPVAAYLALLLQEMVLVRDALGRRAKAGHVHFGGGSPGILSPVDFTRCMEALSESFDIQREAEIAIELDPRGVTEARIAAYRKAGVNRVSLGIQDFNTNVQEAIGRVQPFHKVFESVRLCHDYGIECINMDLIYGLPLQTPETVRETAEHTVLLAPDRIALFGYAHVPWKKKNIRLIDEKTLPDARTRLALFDAAAGIFAQSGYLQVGIDHFVKPHDPMAVAFGRKTLRRNFQGYTVDGCEALIGLGASAIGSFEQGYVQNTTDAKRYEDDLARHVLPAARGYLLTDEDRVRRRIIESLMCYAEADIHSACAGTNIDVSRFDPALSQLAEAGKDGLVSFEGYRIRINGNVPQAARIVSAAFDAYLDAGAARHAQVS